MRPVRGSLGLVVVTVMALAATACGAGDGADPRSILTWVVDAELPAEAPVGLAPGPSGTVLVGELMTGRVFRWSVADDTTEPLARLDVATEGQRGLLATVPAGDDVIVSRVRPEDGRLVVERLEPAGSVTPVWDGPVSTDRANGGRLLLLAEDRLVVGIGDLLDPAAVDDPGRPNGKLLVLDPHGPADQTPTVLASGFNNPFAYAATDDGTIWVADNAPTGADERMIRVGPDGTTTVVSRSPEATAPAGLAVLTDGSLAVCRYLDGDLDQLDPSTGGVVATIATGCRYAVAALPDGRLVYGADERVVVLRPADPAGADD